MVEEEMKESMTILVHWVVAAFQESEEIKELR